MSFRCEHDIEVKQIIAKMLVLLNVSTRNTKIFIRNLNLICKEQRDGFRQIKNYDYFYPIIVAFMLLLKDFNSKIYKKYFAKELENNYEEESKEINKTRYYAFLNDIKQNTFYQIITLLQASPFGQYALLHIISLFDNIHKINLKDLSTYIEKGVTDVHSMLREFVHWHYPSNINALAKQLQIIK